MFQDVPENEIKPGIKFWKNKNNNFAVLMLHYTADPDKNPNTEKGAVWLENEKKGTSKATWMKEYEIDFSTKSGKLIFGSEFCDFSPNIHLVNSFDLPEPYELLLSLDFGQRNPTCALIGAFTPDNRLYIIDEYYKPALPSASSREMFEKFSYLFGAKESVATGSSIHQKRSLVYNVFPTRVIDPTTKSKNRTKIKLGDEIEYSVKEEFYDHGWDFELGNNDWLNSITRIREYMEVSPDGRTNLYIFKDKCPNLSYELQHYRYKELSEFRQKEHNSPEEPVKKNDHAVDSLRYMVMTRPASPQLMPIPKTRIQRDIESLLKPKVSFGSWDVY
jgi:hypothetical protein